MPKSGQKEYNLLVEISDHPIWKQVTPYKTQISKFKKPFHLMRIKLARTYAKMYPSSLFVGVTGSVGKTSTVTAINHVLSQKYPILSTRTNLDPILNIPETVLKVRPKIKKVILEMGIEYKGEMDFYLSIVRPKTAVITRIYFAHSQFLGDVEQIIEEKSKLVAAMPTDGLAIINGDDINSRKIAEKCKGNVIFYGKDSKNCAVWAGNIKIENFQTVFELNYGVERVQIEYKLLGEHQIYPALAAATLGISEGMSLIQIKRGLEKVEPVEHRMQVVTGPSGAIILDDTYNSSPIAAEAAIDTLLSIPARRRIVVFGEMRELGEYSDAMHRQIARKLYKEKIDLVFLGTGDAQIISDELLKLGYIGERLETNLQNSQLVAKLLKILQKNDVCLIKGSRSLRLDEVVKRITKKKG